MPKLKPPMDPICHYTPEGHALLREAPNLRRVVDTFWNTPKPEDAIAGRFIGVGRFSTVRMFDGVVVKVSSPTSSDDTDKDGRPRPAENLVRQYNFLTALRQHMEQNGTGIVVPRQLFVMHSEYNSYLSGQEYMDGWTSLHNWRDAAFPDESDEAAWLAQREDIRQRILAAVSGKEKLLKGLNDLHLDNPDMIHTGNILIPEGARPGPDLSLCIIDQPKTFTGTPDQIPVE